MVNVLRRWSQPIMVLITVLVIVSFTYWGPGMRSGGGKRVALTLYGNDISVEDMTRQARRVAIFAAIRGEYIQALDPLIAYMGRDPDSAAVAKSFVLDYEMDQLGLTANEEERIDVLKNLPIFQDQDGSFDPDRFQRFKANVLNPQGFSDGDFEQIFLTGEVRARKLQGVIGSVAVASAAEVRDQIIKQQQKTETSYVVFRRNDFRKDVKVTEEDLKKRYEEQKELYKTPEQRKVRYAAFLLPTPADNKPIEGKERTTKLQALANEAYAFHEDLVNTKGDFAELAKKHGATVAETKDFFSPDAVPAELEGSEQIGEAAFKLTKENPYSPHVSLEKGTYVLQLLEIKPPEQRKFEDARKEVEDQMISAKADELAQAKAKEMRPKLAEAMKGGKSFADAAKELGLTVVVNPTAAATQRGPRGEFDQVITPAAAKLAPGEISEVVTAPTNDAALIVHVDYRSPIDEKQMDAAREGVAQQIEGTTRYLVFQNWLAERGRAAGLGKLFDRASGG